MNSIYESKIWADIERIATATGRHEDDVYGELIIEFQELVAQRLEESYITRRPKLKINVVEFRKMYIDGVFNSVIANHFHISLSSVRTLRIKLHLPPRHKYMVKFDKREYKRLFKAGIHYDEMARILGMSRNTVMQTRKRLNLPARNNWSKKVSDTQEMVD